MSKHTPGPWIFTSEKECFSPEDCDGDDRGYYAIAGSPELQIHDPIPGVRYADAKLIAAAPDLLAACIAASKADPYGGDHDLWMSLVQAAIAKATT